ncbi:cytochrome P450 [Boletus coccyginus]|nr:cytochrome P450 [Boletus coccyginus]
MRPSHIVKRNNPHKNTIRIQYDRSPPRYHSPPPMSTWATPCILTLAGVAVLCIGQRYYNGAKCRSSLPLPPGPPGLPWIGNVIGVDASAPWLTYRDWANTYGDLVYSRLLGQDIIIINSEKVAKDLLENRSRNYSDRPYLVTNDLCGVGFNSAMLPYGDRWRLHRRFFHQTFRIDGVRKLLPIQHRKSCQLLRRLLDTPEQLADHVFEYMASAILNSVYDYDPQSRDDELLGMVAKVLEIAVHAVTPRVAIVVATFPGLLKLPSWFPGMSFVREMEIAKELSEEYVERPFAYSLQKPRSARSTSSMVHDALRSVEENGTPPDGSWTEALKETAATAFLAASETTNSVIMTFCLMMVMNPEAQKNAQAQIDAVVGNTRLPTIDDRPSLPYVDAILREILRYSPPAPLSAPRAIVADDTYAGFHIPKGAIVMTNLWSMTHDESKYPNPYAFLPERFLNDDGSLKLDDGENVAFGFGRRICVGRHFADTSAWSVISKVLATFTISKALDENGVEIPVEPKFCGAAAVHPLPFRCRIVPRIEGMNKEKLEELISASSN